jgi:hypothetical protein
MEETDGGIAAVVAAVNEEYSIFFFSPGDSYPEESGPTECDTNRLTECRLDTSCTEGDALDVD